MKNKEKIASKDEKRASNGEVKPSAIASEKIKTTIYLTPESMKDVDELYKQQNCFSRTVFIEKAIKFYVGYLEENDNVSYAAPIMTEMINAALHLTEQRISRNLFKIAVELGKISHMVAATNDIDDETVESLHRMCVDEVRRINGVINYESAVRFQKDE